MANLLLNIFWLRYKLDYNCTIQHKKTKHQAIISRTMAGNDIRGVGEFDWFWILTAFFTGQSMKTGVLVCCVYKLDDISKPGKKWASLLPRTLVKGLKASRTVHSTVWSINLL